ncbi:MULTISPECIES: hypothetical protein [unclassified Streptomyces]|uniref:hypothetical protein n=1 Tax=unclassified Streptomyces TaxID=2593676 RepID=UPI002DDA140E|nr:hypothetical protein [Streptomyces sp. NBC_01766]WSC20975.1 hypothetical protein OIE60_15525 [Streptomyces sp. NBC_01766]
MTHDNELRLLPWAGPEGKPCYLSTDDANGYLSRLADNTEAMQLGMAAELLEHAAGVLGHGAMEPNELLLLVVNMSGALRDALRVAISRGHRLPSTDARSREESNQDPQLPAAAFG